MAFTRKETDGLDSGTVPGSPTALRRLICPKTNTEPLTISLRLIVERGLRTNSRVPAAAAVLRVELHDRLHAKLDRTAEIVCIKDRPTGCPNAHATTACPAPIQDRHLSGRTRMPHSQFEQASAMRGAPAGDGS